MPGDGARRCQFTRLISVLTSQLVKRHHSGAELLERRLEFLDDLSREDVGNRKVGGVLEAVVLEPQQIEVGLVTV